MFVVERKMSRKLRAALNVAVQTESSLKKRAVRKLALKAPPKPRSKNAAAKVPAPKSRLQTDKRVSPGSVASSKNKGSQKQGISRKKTHSKRQTRSRKQTRKQKQIQLARILAHAKSFLGGGEVKPLSDEPGWATAPASLVVMDCGGEAGDCLFESLAVALKGSDSFDKENNEISLLTARVASLSLASDSHQGGSLANRLRRWASESLTLSNFGEFVEKECQAKQRLVEQLGFYPPHLWDPDRFAQGSGTDPANVNLQKVRRIMSQSAAGRTKPCRQDREPNLYQGNVRTLFLLCQTPFFEAKQMGIVILTHQGEVDHRIIRGKYPPRLFIFLYHSITATFPERTNISMHWQLLMGNHGQKAVFTRVQTQRLLRELGSAVQV